METAVQSLKNEKSARVNNIPAETDPSRWRGCNTVLTTICSKIWQIGEWPTPWTQTLVITLLKKGKMQQCQNFQMISLISHPSKVMLRIILN